MDLKTAFTIGLVGAALSVVMSLGLLLGGQAYIDFMYRGDVPIGGLLGLFPSLALLIFFAALHVKQK